MPVYAHENYLPGMLIVSLLTASAHADNEDAIAKCSRIASSGERILCLENALRGDLGEPDGNAHAVPVAEGQQKTAATEQQSTNAKENVAADANQAESSQFGLTERQKKPDPGSSIAVVVVEVSKTAYGKLIYTTDSGQVWLQTDKKSIRYKQLPIDMTIRDGASGSYCIQPRSGGRRQGETSPVAPVAIAIPRKKKPGTEQTFGGCSGHTGPLLNVGAALAEASYRSVNAIATRPVQSGNDAAKWGSQSSAGRSPQQQRPFARTWESGRKDRIHSHKTGLSG